MGLRETLQEGIWKLFSQHYKYAAVYAGPESADLIYEGETRVYLNGWVEIENRKHLSPDTVHHIEDQTLP